MTTEEIIAISLIFSAILIAIYKIETIHSKKIKATDKALLELYDRITELEEQLNNK